MLTEAQQRTVFRKAAHLTSMGRTGERIIVCPRCATQLRTVTVQVNGFNEWSFKKEYRAGGTYYYSVEYDGRGCCF